MQRSKSKENLVDLSRFNLQDILEPFPKASASAKSQYLSVSRYVAGQVADFRKNSLRTYMGDKEEDKDSGRYSKNQSSGK